MRLRKKMGESACLRRSLFDNSIDPRIVCLKKRDFHFHLLCFSLLLICFRLLTNPQFRFLINYLLSMLGNMIFQLCFFLMGILFVFIVCFNCC